MLKEKILYVIATPIGHLKDMTYRAVETLKNSDIILAEDTRVSGKLLKHYEINNKMLTYNSYREKKNKNFRSLFEKYSQIALICDAGTPNISDPGFAIINYCHENKIVISPIPGACALSTSLSICGFSSKNALFIGFLPNKKGKRKNQLTEILENEKKTIVLYESPYRIKNLLEILNNYNKNLIVLIARELTKKHEEIIKAKVSSLKTMFENLTCKGEFVVVINNLKKKLSLDSD